MLPRFTAPLLKVSLQQFLLLITPYLALKKKLQGKPKRKKKKNQQNPTEFKETERDSEPDIAGMWN